MSLLKSGNPSEEKKHGVYSIAIIGGGATMVAFVNSFINHIVSQHTRGIQLTIFDKEDGIGSGYAYQEDLDCLRLNAPPEIMSICAEDRNHFTEWLEDKEEYCEMLKESHFLPRRVYRDYLTDTLYASMEKAKNYSQCKIVFKKVADLRKRDNDQYEIITEEGQSFLFDFVLLAVGSTESDDHYGLMGQPGYIHEPYPAKATLTNIGKTDTVAIMGTRLTAIDIAIALRHNGHEGRVFMISKHGRLPLIVDKRGAYETKFCTVDNLTHVLEKHHYVSLRHIVRLVRREYKAAGFNWREVLLDKGEWHDDAESVRQNIATKRGKPQVWFDMLFGLHHVIAHIWKDVPQRDKEILTQKYLPVIFRRLSAIPIINADQIYDLLRSEQLHILRDIDEVHKKEQGFRITLCDGRELTCDYLINATGHSRDVSKNNLIKSLFTKGYVAENSNGGIQVDYDSGAIIDKSGKKHETFRALGYVTYGTHLIISIVPMIVPLAHQMAQECAALASAEQTPFP